MEISSRAQVQKEDREVLLLAIALAGSQRKLANALGISRQAVNRWANKELANLKLSTVERLWAYVDLCTKSLNSVKRSL